MGETILSKDLDGSGYPIFSADSSAGAWGQKKQISKVLKRGSIIIGARGTIGNPRLPDHDEFGCTQTTIAVTPSSEVDPCYLKLALESSDIKSIAAQQAVPMLTIGQISRLEIPVPPLPEQKKIAEILSGVDREIAVLLKKKRKLEKTLAAYLSAAIPSDCESMELQEVCKVTDGAHKTPTYATSGIPFLRVTDIKTGNLDPSSFKYIPEEEHLELIKRCRPEKGDILLSKNGTIGVPRLIDWDWDFSIFVSLALLKIKDRKRLCPEFCELLLKSPSLVSQIFATSKQGTVTNLHLEEIRKFKVHLPPYEKQQEIISEYQALCRLIGACSSLVEKKKFLRTAITSDLLSGRKRVSV